MAQAVHRLRPAAEVAHPAKFSDPILELLGLLLPPLAGDRLVLDPMAGVGRLAELPVASLLGEIQLKWARACPPPVYVADAAVLPFRDNCIWCVATSPTYGNRMADTYAGDGTQRYTYTIYHGGPLHSENTGAMQWGHKYREKNAAILKELYRVIENGGWLVLNVSDHIRKFRRQPVARWWGRQAVKTGFTAQRGFKVYTDRMKNGENGEARVEYEVIYLLQKQEAAYGSFL